MVVMSDGRISALGTPLELYYRPPNRFCADFLGEANLIAATVEGGKREEGGGVAAVQTPLGRWLGTAVEASRIPVAEEQGVLCLIRPENLQPVRDDRAGLNVFEAEIKGLRMNGPTVTVTLSAASLTLRATVLTQDSLELRKGARLFWGVQPKNTVLIAAT
ncbi:MAG: hypothetical protein WCG36_09020, partial [bacterium]